MYIIYYSSKCIMIVLLFILFECIVLYFKILLRVTSLIKTSSIKSYYVG